MTYTIVRTTPKEILPLRQLFLSENYFQIRYEAYHHRGWTDTYLIAEDGQPIGYGSVKGLNERTDRDTLFEFYLTHDYRQNASSIFAELVTTAHLKFVETQSNEPLLTNCLHQHTQLVERGPLLFGEGLPTRIVISDVDFRKRQTDDVIFAHTSEPVGDFVLVAQSSVVATGGYLLHYNFPFADIFMEVEEQHRKKGYGSFLVQEVQRECKVAGRVPAARCHRDNLASRNTLLKAGFQQVGEMLIGKIDR